jgi:signal transduction histidine kinase
MRNWLRGKPGGLAAFVLIATLVAGGLGWATAAALGLEREQLAQRAEAELAARLRLALWRLDSRVAPLLAREDGRPFNHYSAIYAVPLALDNSGHCWPAGTVLEPSPLLSSDLPAWMQLHFQVDPAAGWESPQVLSAALRKRLDNPHLHAPLSNVTPERRCLLDELCRALPAGDVLALARARTQPATVQDRAILLAQQIDKEPGQQAQQLAAPASQMAQMPQAQQMLPPNQGPGNDNIDFNTRQNYQSKVANDIRARNPQRLQRDLAMNSAKGNGANWFDANTFVGRLSGPEVLVNLSPLVPVWVSSAAGQEYLVVLRLVHIEEAEVCQGVILGVAGLEEMLADEVTDLFPDARVLPMRDEVPPQPDRTMTALPFQLDPGPVAPPASPGWTPLRVGLALAWLAALTALLAVGLGGWGLIDLSERRIRFVWAVTHELRTPLTTLRLYLDMLMHGMVRDERQRDEYIRTLHAESDRLHRLIGNVLDFSRLEKQRPHLARARVPIVDLLEQVRSTWAPRCQDAEKELIVEDGLAPGAALWTDGELLQQVLGNLLDNACKYSRGAEDCRLWLRVLGEGSRVVFEVEDRGPGVPVRERRSIFRPFRRGRSADVTAGGVGLGLALALRWSRLLGGRLTLQARPAGSGACFRVELPACAPTPGSSA